MWDIENGLDNIHRRSFYPGLWKYHPLQMGAMKAMCKYYKEYVRNNNDGDADTLRHIANHMHGLERSLPVQGPKWMLGKPQGLLAGWLQVPETQAELTFVENQLASLFSLCQFEPPGNQGAVRRKDCDRAQEKLVGIFALFRPQEHWKPDWERDFEKKLGSSLAIPPGTHISAEKLRLLLHKILQHYVEPCTGELMPFLDVIQSFRRLLSDKYPKSGAKAQLGDIVIMRKLGSKGFIRVVSRDSSITDLTSNHHSTNSILDFLQLYSHPPQAYNANVDARYFHRYTYTATTLADNLTGDVADDVVLVDETGAFVIAATHGKMCGHTILFEDERIVSDVIRTKCSQALSVKTRSYPPQEVSQECCSALQTRTERWEHDLNVS